MAYRKTFRRRTYRRRSTPWYRRKYSAVQLAAKAVKGVRYLKGLVNAELKKYTITGVFGNSDTSYNGSVQSLVPMSQGDADYHRNGNSLLLRYVAGTVELRMDPTAVSTNVRLMILKDTQQIMDSIPTTSDVLVATQVGTGFAPTSKLGQNTVGRFTVLYSKNFLLHDNRPSMMAKFNLNMRHHVRYNGPLGSDLQKGGIYLLIISDKNDTIAPTVVVNARSSYYDN